MDSMPIIEGNIYEGTITRIETYGAFCVLKASNTTSQATRNHANATGLIHISQLANNKVEQVEDVVMLGDRVWVKILQVSEENNARRRIQLSLKDVAQDGSQRDFTKEKIELEQSLNSMIGMGIARDPMATSRLILKGNSNRSKTTFRGGYELVGDTEGELPSSHDPTPTVTTETRVPALGRGRGLTLPAWMTSKSNDNGPTGDKGSGDDDDKYNSDRKHQTKKKRDRKKANKRKKKRHKHSNERPFSPDNSSPSSADDPKGLRAERHSKLLHKKKKHRKHSRNSTERKDWRKGRSPSISSRESVYSSESDDERRTTKSYRHHKKRKKKKKSRERSRRRRELSVSSSSRSSPST